MHTLATHLSNTPAQDVHLVFLSFQETGIQLPSFHLISHRRRRKTTTTTTRDLIFLVSIFSSESFSSYAENLFLGKMSCNGCRVLRKGCSESCILRPCLQWIDTAQAQANATVFVAKFFGRAGLMSFISAVPETQRPALFQSLLFEACGRTVNPVCGAVGLLSAGKWHLCQSAVETVLRGGTLHPLAEISAPDTDDSSEEDPPCGKGFGCGVAKLHPSDLDLGLAAVPIEKCIAAPASRKRRPSTPSMESEGSVTTSFKSEVAAGGDRKLLNLFS